MKMNYFTNFVKKYSRIFLIQQQKRYLLMTSPARKQRNQQQTNPNNPLLFTTIDGGSFIQCASSVQNHTVLVLSKQTKLYLSGVFAFQTLYGHVEVNGYLFAPKKFNASHFMPISIPNGQFPTVFSIRDDISDKLNVEQVQSRLREFVSDPSKIIPFVQENYPVAILLIKLEMDIASKFIAQQMVHFFRNTFQITKFIAEQMPFNIFQSFGRSLGYKLYLANKSGDDGHMPLGELEAHQNVLDRLREVVKRINFKLASEKKCIVFIVGNKGVGKSTAARFLANSLNSGQGEGRVFQGECRVFLLDSDVGQSEMNPAGCISVNEVNRPMIGAPFVSQNCTFQNSYFFGSNSPTVDFDFYIKLVARLVDQFHNIAQEDANTPSVLIVNTVGWIEDLGYDLMLRMLSTVKPSILINLALDLENSLNFLVPENYRKIHCRIERKPRMSPLNDAPSPNSLTPAQLRHCQVAAYFAQLFLRTAERQSTNFLRLSELQPYRLRFCSTSIYIHPELRHVDDKFMLCNLNYTMVALCKIEEGFEKYFEKKQILADNSLPTRLLLRKDLPLELSNSWEDGQLLDDSADDILPVERSSPPMLRCFGFGLIRAIHPQRKLFYILTPVEPNVLPQINVLAFGHGLNTPEMLYELNPREAVPYLVELETGLQENYKKLYSPLRNVTSARRGSGPPPTKRKS